MPITDVLKMLPISWFPMFCQLIGASLVVAMHYLVDSIANSWK